MEEKRAWKYGKKNWEFDYISAEKNAIKSYAAQSMIVPTAFAGHSKIFTPVRFVKDTELF